MRRSNADRGTSHNLQRAALPRGCHSGSKVDRHSIACCHSSNAVESDVLLTGNFNYKIITVVDATL